MKRSAGFTLFEILIAITIAVMVILIAIPSVQGMLRTNQLRATYESFDAFVHKAHNKSVSEQRAYVMTWGKDGIDLAPERLKDDEAGAQPEHFSFDGGQIVISRPAALIKNPPPEWTFWRSGICEPAIISYKGPAGTWTVKYDPLTVQSTYLNEEVQ